MINIAIRADSSTVIGTGHIMRCLTLANAIKKTLRANIYFFCRQAEGNISQLVLDAGFDLVQMAAPTSRSNGASTKKSSEKLAHSEWLGETQENDVKEFIALAKNQLLNKKLSDCISVSSRFDFIITDHYGIDARWHQQVRNITRKIVVIDDIADRAHECDFLIDQTFLCPVSRYKKLTPAHSQTLLGTDYAMLRDEFNLVYSKGVSKQEIYTQRKERLHIQQGATRLLIMFGGTDPDNLTLQALTLLGKTSNFRLIDVIIGTSAKHIAQVMEFCQLHDEMTLHIAPSNISELMLSADIAIGAAGTTSWERCAVGLPTILIVQASNQNDIAAALTSENVCLSYQKNQLTHVVTELLPSIQTHVSELESMINNSLKVCDGQGCQRIVDKVFSRVQ
ncbi:UDP-2,4-diacetamido-2,4,6-trideoxy-beta-L-altropyranose hydrolase [Thalassotalea euphylliae]|uniref:UDP-2,4-diacetamido-2,4, 6-trideoxy-beta-L-altropyranose hydrolase n=1 Tax=Thalassotalea euphylliae TaxID=1655234 RepID=A0A3E0UD62_9GAMM|nr:UDP-2,4-diacetamido-2,4,6-trideoxy-beta-L-altropyranose hydrolase [Thalassotalea euphylliae]REL34819.1 UDP-2,4-diacetamido-2,4,6-trideoxy-beta-L-altropyranose hydrolase [Thalassotalea euphylliae]